MGLIQFHNVQVSVVMKVVQLVQPNLFHTAPYYLASLFFIDTGDWL